MNLNYAKIFIKEYDVKSIDIDTLETIISKLGYNLVVYNSLFSYNDDVGTLIEIFSIEQRLKTECCFTCKNKFSHYIFVRDNLEENELIHLLLHEIGHIYKHHVDNNPAEKSTYYEYEANKFADDVKYYVNQNHIKRKALYAVPAFLLSALVLTVATLNLKSNNSNEFSLPMQETQSVTETITDEPVSDIPETSAEEITELEEDDKLYYVAKTGTKYHTKDCYHINLDECITITKEEAEKMGYEPCKDCNPDKQD